MTRKQPNILMIVVDQQRYDCIGYSRDYPVQTPYIDQLAAAGTWFANAYTHIPLCSPARQSLINGRRPESFGGLWNYNISLKVSALSPQEHAWPRVLGRAGYQSGYVGKWNVNPDFDPTAYGYDHYVSEGQYAQFRAEHYGSVRYTASFLGEPDPIALPDTETHWLAGKACQLIEQFAGDEQPWHVRLDFSAPHLPCRPAAPFDQMYRPAQIPQWRNFGETFANKPYIQKQQLHSWDIQDFTWEDWAPIVARYYGMISQVDDAIGMVIRTLEKLQVDDSTLVVFTADHGDMCGGHRMIDKHYVLYDDIVKVPFLLKWPQVIPSGHICDEFVYNLLDLPPTILEMLDLDYEGQFHGTSLVPLLTDTSAAPPWRENVVSTYNGQQFGLYTQRMIRNRHWKYIWNPTDIDELYNLDTDPAELTNVIHDGHEFVVQSLREQLYAELMRCGDGLVNNEWMKRQLLDGRKL